MLRRTLPLLWIGGLPLILLSVLCVDRPLCTFLFDHGVPSGLVSWLSPLFHPSGGRAGAIDLDPAAVINGTAPILILISLFVRPGRVRSYLMLAGASLLLTHVLKNDLKWAFHREWPFLWTEGHHAWKINPADGFRFCEGRFSDATDGIGSFPSGHTAMAFAILLPLGLTWPRLLPWGIAAACAAGLLLVLLCLHYLGDVLAGGLLGITCTLLMRDVLGILTPPFGAMGSKRL
jgi:membrane-associated phospholipid phosphatase